MEFFRTINIQTTEQELQEKLTLKKLDQFCTDLFNLDEPSETEAIIGGVWGEFTLARTKIKGGLRFALVECPNALCWTMTTGYPPKRDAIILHLTINRTQKQDEFIEEIMEFLENLCLQLPNSFRTK